MNCIRCGAPIKRYSMECSYCGCGIESGPETLEAECLLCHGVANLKVPNGVPQILGKSVLYVCILCSDRAMQKIESLQEICRASIMEQPLLARVA